MAVNVQLLIKKADCDSDCDSDETNIFLHVSERVLFADEQRPLPEVAALIAGDCRYFFLLKKPCNALPRALPASD